MASAQYYGQDYKRVFSLKLLHLKVMALFVYLYSVTDTAILIMHVHNGLLPQRSVHVYSIVTACSLCTRVTAPVCSSRNLNYTTIVIMFILLTCYLAIKLLNVTFVCILSTQIHVVLYEYTCRSFI